MTLVLSPAPSTTTDAKLSLREATRRGFGVYETLKRRIDSGELPATRRGNRIYVRESDLEALEQPVAPDADKREPKAPDAELLAWAQKVAADAPPPSSGQIQLVVAILRGGAAA